MKTPLVAKSLIAGCPSSDGGKKFRSFNPAENREWGLDFTSASLSQINEACAAAERALHFYGCQPLASRQKLLLAIANALEAAKDEIMEAAMTETGYSEARLTGEFARMVGQLRYFADVLEQGLLIGATIDLPADTPGPAAVDVRGHYIAKGVVVVFAASNFPLAFSVAGGDTASALAAGCPVIVKAHSCHPVTSELVANCIYRGLDAAHLPPGLFSLIQGRDHSLNLALVSHPKVKAVGFTGSRKGGLALSAACQSRQEPISVYAEMSSVNPVFLAPGAMNPAVAKALFDSTQLGSGQFCTNPGLLFVPQCEELEPFIAELARLFGATKPVTMLSPGIASAYRTGIAELKAAGANVVADGVGEAGNCQAMPALLRVTSTLYSHKPALREEVFGPSTMFVVCDGASEMVEIAAALEGQLTASIWGSGGELEAPPFIDMVQILQHRVGRLIFNQPPTGVRVCGAMAHGGPFPASTADTSVGANAMRRFMRFVCLQNAPQALLPEYLRTSGRSIPAIVGGKVQYPGI